MAGRHGTTAEDFDVHRFFNEILFGDDGWLDLRALPGRHQEFFRPDDVEGINGFIARHQSRNLYFGVAKRREAGDGTLANCSTVDAVWADIDFKAQPELEAKRRLNDCPLQPNIIIQSGHGLHLYWVLDSHGDVQEEEPRIRSILRRLAHCVGADLHSAEPARVLRIPGTLNHKYDPPRRVSIERFNLAHTYSLAEVDEMLPPEPDGRTGNRREFVMPSKVSDGSRNDTLFRLARSFVAKGLDESSVLAALRAENRAKCEPPLEDEEVQRIVANATTQLDRTGFGSRPTEEGREETNLAPRTAAEIMAGPVPVIDWIWAPYLATGTLATLVAYMKVGKSTLAYALAIAVAKGHDFLGFPTAQGAVLILAVEEHQRDWHIRLRMLGLHPRDPIHVHGGKLRGFESTLAALRVYILEHDIKLVILDTLSRFWTDILSEEGDNIQVGRTIDPFLELARETGVVVVLVHHERKSGGEDGRGIRGGSALFGLVDQALLLERKQGSDRSLRILKALGRYSETPPELVIEYKNGEFVNRGAPEAADSDDRARRIWAALSEEPQSLEALVEATGLSAKQLRRILDAPNDDVIRDGQGKKGDPYTYRLAPADAVLPSPTLKGEEKQAKGRDKGSARKGKRGQE